MPKIDVTLDLDDAVARLVGEIEGFSSNGSWYYQEDNEPFYIEGKDVLEAMLDKIPGVSNVVFPEGLVTLTIDARTVWDFMVSSDYRAMDYTEEEAAADIESDPIDVLSSMAFEYEVHPNARNFVQEDDSDPDDAFMPIEDTPDIEDGPVGRHSHVTTGAPAPRKESTMTQRTPRNRTNAAVARAQARTAMKLRLENQRTAAVNRLRRRLAAVRAARAERVAGAQPEAQPRRPSRILRSAAKPVARRDHEVTTKSVARDEVRRRIAAIRQKAQQARQAAAPQGEVKPADRFAALRERLAQRRRIAQIRSALAERRAAVEHDAKVAPPVIRVDGVRYERID